MKINKADLDRKIWWEDENGNVIDIPKDYCGGIDERVKNGYGMTYHSLFPLEITEHVSTYSWEPKTRLQKILCKNNRLYRILEKKHHKEKTFSHLIDLNTYIGGGNQDVIMAMVNSGDYTLSEALILWSQSCERCANVLAYHYLNGKDGYEEYSDEWKKCNTVCRFCKDEQIEEQTMTNEKPIAFCYSCGKPLYFESEMFDVHGEPHCSDCYDKVCYEQHIIDEENGLYDEWN